MLKQVSRNSFLYRNTNNVGVIFEFLGNNAFSELELKELADFIQQNNLFCEFYIVNHKGIKTYYVSFYLGETGWANNLNTYNSKTFFERYNSINNLIPQIKKLSIFEGDKIKDDVNLRLYNLDKEEDSDYKKNVLKKLKYNKKSIKNHILQNNFSNYMRTLLQGYDYKKYILNQDYAANVNYEFHPIEQEIFDVTLKFLTGNKYFIFPFYLKGVERKSGDFSYQELDLGEVTAFFDSYIANSKQKGKPLNSYEYKISIKPSRVIADAKNNQVSVEGNSTKFDVSSINDDSNMFFEFQNSIFLYTKRPDIQKILNDFSVEMGTNIELVQGDIPKDFNMQYLSHNKFSDAFHIGHIRNLQSIVSNLKEYYPASEDGMYIGREYFSQNDFQINFFDIVGKDDTGNLEFNANTMVIGTTGAGKTYLAQERLFRNNHKDQVIIFDNMGNFDLFYEKLSDKEKEKVGLLKYDVTFPNMVGKITKKNITAKQSILYRLLIGSNSDLSSENKQMINANVNNYITKNVGGFFKLSLFKEYLFNKKTTELFTSKQKALLIDKIDSMDNTISKILDSDSDFESSIYKYQKVILSYGQLLQESDSETGYFILEMILEIVRGYLATKKSIKVEKQKYPYTMVMFDEAHQTIGKSKTLDATIEGFVREIRNYRANMTLITQNYIDIPIIMRNMMNFFIILDPTNWKAFEKEQQSNNRGKIGAGTEMDTILDNFQEPIEQLEKRFDRDRERIKSGEIESKEATRFCMFAVTKTGKKVYMLDTKS